jgi:hypothetical protein
MTTVPAQAWQKPWWRVQCHKVSTKNAGTGAWSDGACTKPSEKGEYSVALMEGEERPFTFKSEKSILHTGAGIEIECVSDTGKGRLIGKFPGTDTEEMQLEKCKVVGNTKCHVSNAGNTSNETIQMTNLATKLVFLTNKISTPVGDTVKSATGKAIELKFTAVEGGTCAISSASLEGETAGEWLEPEVVAVSKTLNFPNPAIKKAWEGVAEPLTEITFELEFVTTSKFSASLETRELLQLESKEAWSVSTATI